MKEAYDANKTNEVRAYAKGDRPYLGKESEKFKQHLDPSKLPKGYGGDLRVMTIDDIRELLNKNE